MLALNHGIKSAVFWLAKLGNVGRTGGGRNRGYWFRKDRGWFVTEGTSAIPLCDDKGNCIKDAKDVEGAKAAYARYVIRAGKPLQRGFTLMEACRLYLDHAKGLGRDLDLRRGLLYDLCTGFPARFQDGEPTAEDRIHPGYGGKQANGLTTLDVERWLAAHPGWKSHRAALQAVRRVLNYCVGVKALDANPLRGLKVPKVGQRETYLPPEVEQAIYAHCKRVAKRSGKERSPALALAIQVCVRTGCRPDIEFNSLEARHVKRRRAASGGTSRPPKPRDGRSPGRSTSPRRSPRSPGSRSSSIRPARCSGVSVASPGPWTACSRPSRLRDALKHLGVTYIEPLIPYTCRHTYAKRMLGGYWGPPVTLEVLAGLMGNSPKVCWDHYAKWSNQYVDPFWNAIDPEDRNSDRGKTSPEQQPPSSSSSGPEGDPQ